MTETDSANRALPTGTVTFLFSDIEESTRLLHELGDGYAEVLAKHRRLLRTAFTAHNGVEIGTEGDSFFVAFARASDAVAAAVEGQLGLKSGPVRVRMGLHTGEPLVTAEGYVGMVVHRAARIAAVGHGRQVLLSQAVATLLEERLPLDVTLRELGSFRLKDLANPERIYQVLHPELWDDFPALRSLEASPNNLPQQLTSFIGRDKAIADIEMLLGTARMLTLTGSGGSGKTRLALQVAAGALDQFADGAWFVELASLADPSLVAQTAASVLSVEEQPGKPITQTLAEHLRAKQLLLILDNCEHLLDACATLANTLLRQCPNVKILASSREALGITGEQSYRVPSLSLPDRMRTQTPQTLSVYESVQLFIDRARLVRSDFQVDNQNAPAVASLCHHLDGIPLAIELAAARVRTLAVEEIDRNLDQRFRLLTGGSRTAVPRQQTLRSLIDWSYDLLRDPEKLLLHRVSVFAGGCTLTAAERICSGEGIQDWEVLELLSSLSDKSLMVVDERDGHTRYGLLETVRQYAGDRLREAGEEASWQARHLAYFVQFAEAEVTGEDQRTWLDRLETEHDNFRVALAWSSAGGGSVTSGLRLADALAQFWIVRGYVTEGRDRVVALLNAERGKQDDALRGNALGWAAELARIQGEYSAARVLNEESLTIRQALGDRRGVVASLNCFGLAAFDEGDYPAARTWFERSLAIIRELGESFGIAMTAQLLGAVLQNLGNSSGARTLYEESLAIFRNLGDQAGVAILLGRLGAVAHSEGDHAGARNLYAESLGIYKGLGDRRRVAGLLRCLADVALDLGRPGPATSIFGAEEQLRDEIALPLAPRERARHDRMLAVARAALGGDAAFDRAWREGHAMSFEQAIDFALRETVGRP